LLLISLVLTQLFLEESLVKDRISFNSVEAGFEKQEFGSSFRVPFFILAILYVLFDIEVLLLFPFLIKIGPVFNGLVNLTLISTVISVTLLVE